MPNPPFVEAPTVYLTLSSSMSNSLDTAAIDPYRQGVELTRDPYFYDGLVKIHSGEPNHQLPQRQVGEPQGEIFPDQRGFVEVDTFDPVVFIKQQNLTSSHPTLTYPIVFASSIQNPGNVLDGIIEPLAIRHVAQFTSIDVPAEPHAVRGNVEGGNYDWFENSDIVMQTVEVAQETNGTSAFEDNVDTFSGLPTNMGFFPNNQRVISPFRDEQGKSGVQYGSSVTGSMIAALQSASPASDSYVPAGYKAYPSGFSWQNNNGVGTEALSYGNLTYRKATTTNLSLQLSQEQFLLPNLGPLTSTVCLTLATTNSSVTTSGDMGKVYYVTMRVRGVVEQKTYTGGINDGAFLQIGGTPASDNFNVYSITVSNPSQTYYLNRGSSGQSRTYGLDYNFVIQVRGGATVTIAADTKDSQEIINNQDGTGGSPYSVPGIVSPAQPYNGQFIQVDVVSVV